MSTPRQRIRVAVELVWRWKEAGLELLWQNFRDRPFKEYRVRTASRQVSRIKKFCFWPFRNTNKRPPIACSLVSLACGSATRRLLTYTPPDCIRRRASLFDGARRVV